MSKRSGRIVEFFLPKLPRVEHTSNMSVNYSNSEASASTDKGLLLDQVPVSSQSGSSILQTNQLDEWRKIGREEIRSRGNLVADNRSVGYFAAGNFSRGRINGQITTRRPQYSNMLLINNISLLKK